jgi:hypothetical protein
VPAKPRPGVLRRWGSRRATQNNNRQQTCDQSHELTFNAETPYVEKHRDFISLEKKNSVAVFS